MCMVLYSGAFDRNIARLNEATGHSDEIDACTYTIPLPVDRGMDGDGLE